MSNINDEDEGVAALREEFSLPESVIRHVLRTTGNISNARQRLERQEEQERESSISDAEDVWSISPRQLLSLAIAVGLSFPFYRVKVIEQVHGTNTLEAARLAVQHGWIHLWRGVEMQYLTSVVLMLIKSTMFDTAIDVLTPETGWPATSQSDVAFIATLAFMVSSAFSEVVVCPFRVCGVRVTSSLGPYPYTYLVQPFQQGYFWGYFKGLGALLLSRGISYYFKLQSTTSTSRLCGLTTIVQPLVHAADTVFALMAVHGCRYPTAVHLLSSSREDASPIYDRSLLVLPFSGILTSYVWKYLFEKDFL